MRITGFIILAIFSVWLGGLISFYEKIPNTESELKKADAIIVLTGGKGRIAAGTEMLKQQLSYRMLISGVHEDTRMNEIVKNIDFGSITLGNKARTTKGNALESKQWIEKNNFKSIILVTSNYHMPRSLSIFEREFPELEIQAAPVFPDEFSKQNFWKDRNSAYLILSEYIKYLATF